MGRTLRHSRAALSALIFTTATTGMALSCSTRGDEQAPDEEPAAKEIASDEVADPAGFPDVVASVNGTEILKSDLLQRAAGLETRMGGPSGKTTSLAFYRQVLDEIVGAELLYQASQQRNLSPEDTEVDLQMETIKSRFPEPSHLDEALKAQGLTLELLRTQIKKDMSIEKLVETDIAPKVTVTEGEKRQFYDNNAARMRQPDRLRLSHILKRVDADAAPEARERAERAIEGLLEEARSGADFATLARDHSEDPGSASNGGELVISRGETVPPFEQAAFDLEPGGVSGVVETEFGFHIIKLSEKIEGQLVPYDQAKERIEEMLKQESLRKEVGATVDSLRKAGKVEIFI
ncbi:MAG TPA: peptidylprolyl isomerase [Vicinamibacteria bacterium]|nr:peptidylprolyl isomerase [Vicinamibacteria bacterium]